MKRKVSAKKIIPLKPEDPVPSHKPSRGLSLLKDFTYNEFKKIADKTAFTQAEWAAMLHVSERTLQRYAKNNGSFASINAERAMQIQQVIKRGKEVFGSIDKFCSWIKQQPVMLENNLSLASLNTAEGIHQVLTQLGRIEQGVLA